MYIYMYIYGDVRYPNATFPTKNLEECEERDAGPSPAFSLQRVTPKSLVVRLEVGLEISNLNRQMKLVRDCSGRA